MIDNTGYLDEAARCNRDVTARLRALVGRLEGGYEPLDTLVREVDQLADAAFMVGVDIANAQGETTTPTNDVAAYARCAVCDASAMKYRITDDQLRDAPRAGTPYLCNDCTAYAIRDDTMTDEQLAVYGKARGSGPVDSDDADRDDSPPW